MGTSSPLSAPPKTPVQGLQTQMPRPEQKHEGAGLRGQRASALLREQQDSAPVHCHFLSCQKGRPVLPGPPIINRIENCI